MSGVEITRGISGIVTTSTTIIFLLFGNFLLRKSNGTIFGVEVPGRLVHAVLGPVLVLVNAVLLVYLCALARTAVTAADIVAIKQESKFGFLGFLLNPFYVGRSQVASAIGYGFLIVLWWMGFHVFTYSLSLSNNPANVWLFGWQVLIYTVFLALGLASMVAIQVCWQRFGPNDYVVKSLVGFAGIAIGAFVPPVVLRLGLPPLPFLR